MDARGTRRTVYGRILRACCAGLAAVILAVLSMRTSTDVLAAENLPPSCSPFTRFVAPGETLDILIPCSDDNGTHLLVLSVVTPPTKGTVSVVDYAVVRYTAGVGVSGTDSFTIRAMDPFGAMSAPATVSITIAANRIPVCQDRTGNAKPGGVGSVSGVCTDPDGDSLSAVSIVVAPTQGTVTASGCFDVHCGSFHWPHFSYTADPSASGSDSFTYAVTDQRGGTSPPATITISFANRAPTCSSSQTTGTVPGQTRRVFASCSDPDDDPLTITVVTPPAQGSVTIVDKFNLLYTANTNASGPDSFSFRADDGRTGASNTATANVLIAFPNTPPSCNPAPLAIEPGATIYFSNIDVDCSDVDFHFPLTCAIASAPSKGTVSLVFPESCTEFVYTANPGAAGPDAFTITATDQFGAVSAPATVNINIAPCTRTNFVFSRAMQAWYGSSFQGPAKIRDGLQLTDFISGGLSSFIRRDPTVDPRVPAGLGGDPGPWVSPPGLTNLEWVLGTPQTLPAEANLRTALSAGLFQPTFDPTVNRGTRSYMIESFDREEFCDGGPVHLVQYQFFADVSYFELNAREGNRSPACANLTGSVNAGGSVDIAPSCSDGDSDPLSYAIATQATQGIASIVGGQLRYEATSGASGSDTFTYTASDGKGGVSAPATVTMTITGAGGCEFGSQGCTTGFWKTNATKWAASAWPSGFTPSTMVGAVFAVPSCVDSSIGNSTLLQALSFGTGKTLRTAAEGLVRQAAGGVLNAASTCVQYGACTEEVVARTNAALASCDRTRIINLARELETLNSASCPFDQRGICMVPR